MLKRDRETREQKLKEAEDRAELKKQQLEEAEAKFLEDHREDIEKYEAYQEEQRAKEAQEYGEELDNEDEDAADKEPPTLPEFNQAEFLEKFDEETPEIEIPAEVVDQIDNDWVLEESERDEIIAAYWAENSAE